MNGNIAGPTTYSAPAPPPRIGQEDEKLARLQPRESQPEGAGCTGRGAELVELSAPRCPQRGRKGRQPDEVGVLLRVHFLQQWFGPDD